MIWWRAVVLVTVGVGVYAGVLWLVHVLMRR